MNNGEELSKKEKEELMRRIHPYYRADRADKEFQLALEKQFGQAFATKFRYFTNKTVYNKKTVRAYDEFMSAAKELRELYNLSDSDQQHRNKMRNRYSFPL